MKTFRDKLAARKTPKGARAWCYKVGYKYSHCEEELKALNARARKLALGVWQTCLEDSGKLIPQDAPDREAHVLIAAETGMCFQGYIPPHFTHLTKCDTCGYMPSPYPDTPTAKDCTWCRSGHTQEVKEALAESKAWHHPTTKHHYRK